MILAAKKYTKIYCQWIENQANNDKDFLFLGLGPIFLIGVALSACPLWIGAIGAAILILPGLYLIGMVLRAYSIRTQKKTD